MSIPGTAELSMSVAITSLLVAGSVGTRLGLNAGPVAQHVLLDLPVEVLDCFEVHMVLCFEVPSCSRTRSVSFPLRSARSVQHHDPLGRELADRAHLQLHHQLGWDEVLDADVAGDAALSQVVLD